jgi:hypothetical protein
MSSFRTLMYSFEFQPSFLNLPSFCAQKHTHAYPFFRHTYTHRWAKEGPDREIGDVPNAPRSCTPPRPVFPPSALCSFISFLPFVRSFLLFVRSCCSFLPFVRSFLLFVPSFCPFLPFVPSFLSFLPPFLPLRFFPFFPSCLPSFLPLGLLLQLWNAQTRGYEFSVRQGYLPSFLHRPSFLPFFLHTYLPTYLFAVLSPFLPFSLPSFLIVPSLLPSFLPYR